MRKSNQTELREGGLGSNSGHQYGARICNELWYTVGIIGLSIALDHLTLKAAEEGLGTCWIGSFDQDEVKKMLEIPEQYKIVALMTIGYPKRRLKKFRKNRKKWKN